MELSKIKLKTIPEIVPRFYADIRVTYIFDSPRCRMLLSLDWYDFLGVRNLIFRKNFEQKYEIHLATKTFSQF